MVSAETQTFIYSLVDVNQEYNTKLLLYCVIFVYMVVMFYLGNKIKDDEKNWKKLIGNAMRITSTVFIFFYPAFILWFYRTMSLDTILTFMYTSYGIIMSLLIVVGIIFGYEFLADFLGLGDHFRNRRKYRE